MKKTIITKNLYQYQFPPREGQHFGFNIFALIHERDALLIDAGFDDHATAVRDDLLNSGIKPSKIIISHFHDDHFWIADIEKSSDIWKFHLSNYIRPLYSKRKT